MRVTTYMAQQRRMAEILRGQERLEAARDQVSTGKRILRPSDSPAEIGDLLAARGESAALERVAAGLDAARPQMRASETALGDITALLRDARTGVLQANSGTAGTDQREVLAAQLGRLRERLLDLANSQSAGRALFGGTATEGKPFNAGPPVTYAGTATPLSAEVTPGTQFEVSVTGAALLNAKDGTDLFRNLEALESAIRAGDSAGMSAGLARLDEDLSNVTRLRGDLGARLQYVEMARTRTEGDLLASRDRAAGLEEADLALAILEAKSAESAQEATLAMASRLDQPSLLDYLR